MFRGFRVFVRVVARERSESTAAKCGSVIEALYLFSSIVLVRSRLFLRDEDG